MHTFADFIKTRRVTDSPRAALARLRRRPQLPSQVTRTGIISKVG